MEDSMKYQTSKSPFTLIELLVVIAIIAILAAILMPALSQARERGRSATCINNLKQIGMVFHSYAENNNDMPPLGWSLYDSYWPLHLMKRGYFGPRVTDRRKSMIGKISGNYLVCPSDPYPAYSLASDQKPYWYVSYGTNASVNLGQYGKWIGASDVNLKDKNHRFGYHTFTEIAYSKKKASATPMLADSGCQQNPLTNPGAKKATFITGRGTGCEANTYDWWFNPGKYPCYVDIERHNMKAGTVFCDGHASLVQGPMFSQDGHRYVQWLNPWVEHSVYR